MHYIKCYAEKVQTGDGDGGHLQRGKRPPPISDKRKIAAVLICLISIAAAVVALIPSVAKNVKVILAIAYFAILTALFIYLEVRKKKGRLS